MMSWVEKEKVVRKIHVGLLVACWALAGAFHVGAADPLDHPGAQKSMVCSACHGFGGNSPGNHMPIIAGMNAVYFKKAIKDYAEGKRPSPEMEPYSKYVLQFGTDEIADFFASQKRRPPASVKADPKAVSRGASLATQCVACHGPKGDGDAERNIPALRGQPAGYLQTQNALFGSDQRKLDEPGLEENKKRIFKGLGENDFADLAAYHATLK
jgi:cytochrome c553